MSLDSPPSIPDQSTTTDAQGAYLFQNLPSGKYRITETPRSGFVNDSAPTQDMSPLTPLTPVSNSTIDVQLSDPSQLQLSYPTNNKETLTLTNNGLTRQGLVGQLNITVTERDISYTTPLFPSFCVDFYRDISTGQSGLPYSMEPLDTGLKNDTQVKNPGNAGEIAYLYNYWRTHPSSSTAEAAGLQLAIWELEYEALSGEPAPVLLNGSFFVNGLNSNSPEVIDAQNFLTQAQGHNELAVYLNGSQPNNAQGVIAPESLNFTNLPSASPGPLPISIGGVVFDDCSNDGIQQAGETGIPGVTITLKGVDNLGHNNVTAVTTTDSQGAYNFTVSSPGTYSLTETQPATYLQGTNAVGTVNGVPVGQLGPGVDVISNVVLASGNQGINYNFAEITPSSMSGVVYYDLNRNGVMDSPDFGIAHVTVSLNGTNDLGQSVHMTTTTNDDGVYSFGGLRPGTYDLVRTQPPAFRSYKNTVGSLGGTVNTNSFTSCQVPGCAVGVNYLFGELQKPNCRLRDLAIYVGNLFYHFQQTYQRDPVGFTKAYPNLAPSISAGKVPWGK